MGKLKLFAESLFTYGLITLGLYTEIVKVFIDLKPRLCTIGLNIQNAKAIVQVRVMRPPAELIL